MKNFKIVAMICVLFSVHFSFAQTTLEEYNYMSKGYKDDISKGKTLKYGYSFCDASGWNHQYIENGRSFQRQVKFQKVIRLSDRNICAMVMTYQRTDQNDIHYFCIPDSSSSSYIWDLFLQDFKVLNNDLAADALFTVICGTMRFLSQDPIAFAPTTYEEYNYVTKGYRDDISKGKSLKWGYSMLDIGSWGVPYPQAVGSSFQRNVTFKGFFKQRDQKLCGILATYKRTDNNATYDFCIPHTADNVMWNLATEEIRKTLGNNREALFSMAYALIRCASYNLKNSLTVETSFNAPAQQFKNRNKKAEDTLPLCCVGK